MSTFNEISERADEAREAAKSCRTVRDLQLKMGWRHISTALHWNRELDLGLPTYIPRRAGPALPGRACPKPSGKPGKVKEGGE